MKSLLDDVCPQQLIQMPNIFQYNIQSKCYLLLKTAKMEFYQQLGGSVFSLLTLLHEVDPANHRHNIGREPRSCLVQVFNFKLGSFVSKNI